METVVIDDDNQNNTTAPNDIIDLDEVNECNDDVVEVVDVEEVVIPDSSDEEIQKQFQEFKKFTDNCISVDSSAGMLRVIHKVLIPLYKANGCRFNSTFDSAKFDRALTRAFINIEMDPIHRYSHIKELCEVLKALKRKKKVPLTTLPKQVTEKKTVKKRRSRCVKDKSPPKKQRIDTNIINIDDDEYEVPVVNLDEVATDTAIDSINGKENADVNVVATEANKPDSVQKHFIEIEVPNIITISQKDTPNFAEAVSSSTECLVANSNVGTSSSVGNQNMNDCTNYSNTECLLEVVRTSPLITSTCSEKDVSIGTVSSSNANCGTVNVSSEGQQKDVAQQISVIERQIAAYKKLIDAHDVQEVTEDTPQSPYVQCEYYQKIIVELYDKLCRLQGLPSVKHRKVRLHAIDSRPELPMKKLEDLINDNIGSNGLPHFPDFEEVAYCVREANEEGNLGWDDKRVMHEARALFVHCGRALQRKRQRREWRDLLSLVKDKTLVDPADHDPELQARLNMNRQIARCKEVDILEKYTNLEINSRMRTAFYNAISQNDMTVEALHSSSPNELQTRLNLYRQIAQSHANNMMDKYTNLEINSLLRTATNNAISQNNLMAGGNKDASPGELEKLAQEIDAIERYTNLDINSLTQIANNETSQNDCIIVGESQEIHSGEVAGMKIGQETYTAVRENNNIRNEAENGTHIKISLVFSCNQTANNVPLNTSVVNNISCDKTSDIQQAKEQETHNNPNSSQISNNEDIPLINNKGLDSNSEERLPKDTGSNNMDEHNEILAIMNSKRSSHIQVVSIETFDDITDNNEEIVCSAEDKNNGNDSNKEENRLNQKETQLSELRPKQSEDNNKSPMSDCFESSKNKKTSDATEKHSESVETKISVVNRIQFEENNNSLANNPPSECSVETKTSVVNRIQFEENNNSLENDPPLNTNEKTERNEKKGSDIAATKNKENVSNDENRADINTSQLPQVKLGKDKNNMTTDQPLDSQIDKNEENTDQNTENTVVKSEFNTIRALEELGDDYTTTILDVWDPFLVIEISSDSSSDDDDDDDDDDVENITTNSKTLVDN